MQEHSGNILQRLAKMGAMGMAVVARVRRYLVATGMAQTVFGRAVLNDPRLVEDLLNGRQPRPETIARIDAFIAAHPEGNR